MGQIDVIYTGGQELENKRNSVSKSCSKERINRSNIEKRKSQKRKRQSKRLRTRAIIVILLASNIVMGKKLLDDYVEGNQLVHEYTSDAVDNVRKNIKPNGNSEHDFYYDTSAIAAFLAEDPENFDYNFYGVSNTIFDKGKVEEGIDNINVILDMYDRLVGEEDQLNQGVEEFYREMGFVEIDGGVECISTKPYKEYIINKAKVDSKDLDERKTL